MAVTTGHGKQQVNDDILHRGPDTLRARDIIPPYDKQTRHTDGGQARQGSDLTEKPKIANKLPARDVPNPEQQDSAIPKFDLAEEILAEQRRIIAVRRKAPGRKTEALSKQEEAESDGFPIEQPPQILSEQEQIIAEIVARDIQRFCRRNP
ncbi:MAG: hypothetical protein NTX52_08200 [Planctomycetota bacterium]|nr:hypothetical protein [Planctomycetota bacterium]